MNKILIIRSRLLRMSLKILGLTGLLFIMEACYGAPSAYYIEKENSIAPEFEKRDSVSIDQLNPKHETD